MHNISSYGSQCGYPHQRKDLTFRAGWRASCDELFVFVEALVFDVMYDGYLKDSLKNTVSPADACAHNLKELLERISSMADKENKDALV